MTHAVSLHAVAHHDQVNRIRTPDTESVALPDDADLTSPGDLASPAVPSDSLSPPGRLRDPLSPVVGAQNTSRIPSGPHGKSTRMIAALQTELEHTKTHLDRVKQEVRNCRREIGTVSRAWSCLSLLC